MARTVGEQYKYTCNEYTIMVEVINISKGGTIYLEVKEILLGTPTSFGIGFTYPVTEKQISQPSYQIWVAPIVKGGATCSKCSGWYPYAKESSNFQCWACRSGW